ncbi:hypothetical protein HYH03_014607 [Edaphochlamys debaryana]|uniref:ATP-dependent RNA helicase n=1 Tax=Edaphochlamys debaryana TaxID=47281 RepID=A0A835XMN1_9CHLO|nr:hypothetical protein HYH03_014607 [Edaphochlamys debaryana]|eukprot:KAG2486676.1 hypothetical protein HYH03_014607 [Edaphochlamys debaryana]
MGGIKNLEAKKKANKVFSSGGGGGTKGPATVDKRSQEVKCPYCDKVYSQASSGRLKDHIATRHADQLAGGAAGGDAGGAGAGPSTSAAAPATAPAAAAAAPAAGGKVGAASGGAAAAAAAPAAAPALDKEALKAAAAAATRNAAAAAAAAVAAKAGLSIAPVPGVTAPAAGVSAAGGSGGVMTLNSRAGYYTSKSPSMLLHEWVQKEKRPKARIVPRQVEGGKWTCKVVLPDPKKQEDDVVVFLDEAWAADDEAEARERGAVAALNRVQGDRALERILPRPYVPLWGALGEAAKSRREAAAARHAADERRKAAAEARRRREAMQGPKAVVMSAAKQNLVRSLLRDRGAALGPSDLGGDLYGGSGSGVGDDEEDEGLAEAVEKLSGMGFSPVHVQLAYERVVRRGTAGSGSAVDVETLLDWLLLNLPSDQLPTQFTKGSGTNMVNIVARNAGGGGGGGAGSGAKSGGAAAGGGGAGGAVSVVSVARLMSYGFSSGECEAALAAAGGDEAAAHVRLYGGLTGVNLRAAPPPDEAAEDEAWAEELMVLESIYDTQFLKMPEGSVRLCLELPEGCAGATRGDAPLVLEFTRLPSADGADSADGAGPRYPTAPPLVSVSCAGLTAGALRHLTIALAQEAVLQLGEPCLHALAAKALEEAAAMDESSLAAAERAAATPAAAAGGKAAARNATDAGAGAGEGGLERQDSSLVEGFEGLGLAEEEEQEDAGEEEGAAQAGKAGARQVPHARRPPGARADASKAVRRRRPQIDVAAESARLSRLAGDLAASPGHAAMRRQRSALPAAAKREELLRLLRENEVVVVSGATGCGKSTQVPQYILEEAIAGGRGAACNIIVTQPRRISALGLASRVASERGEGVGETVGYSVKLEHRTSAVTRLTFVTTGILLRRLLSDPDLEGTTHVVLDEVHERSIEIDLLLLLLRDLLARRRSGSDGSKPDPDRPPLKIVLMSATADADLFGRYMSPYGGAGGGAQAAKGKRGGGGGAAGEAGAGTAGVGMITIPGFTYPVREFYLEDALELTHHVIGRSSRYARKGGKRKGGGGKEEEGEDDGDGEEGGGGGGSALSGALPSYSETTLRSMEVVDENQINYDLLCDVVGEIIARSRAEGPGAFLSDWPQAFASGRGDTSGGGAVLVFLPGAPEISRLQRALLDSDRVLEAAGGRAGLRVLPLHGSLSSSDQTKVFGRPPAGVTKVVLATNVAETSITIDDVSVVIDAGRVKEMSHDPERGILRLQEGWVSQAAAQQRRGRAGRVRPGVCFRLFSSATWRRMPPYTQPEMLRSPLESVCLLIKGMTSGAAGAAIASAAAAGGGAASVAAFLARCLSPPPTKAVSSAVGLLRAIGAFDGSEELTALGRHLNRMPMDPRVGKALVYGCMLGCLDPVLTVTAALAHGRPVFLNLQSAGEGVAEARAALLKPAMAARSDHIALVAAYNAWCRAVDKGGRRSGQQLCNDCGLSESSLEAVQAGRAEYARVLGELGFLDMGLAYDARRLGPAASLPGSDWLSAPANRNAGNARFTKAALCAGFYPSVLRVDHPPAKYVQVHGGTAEVEADPKDLKYFDRERGRTFMHPGSLLFSMGKIESGWVVFTQMTETSKLFVREASMVPVYAMLLFGGEVAVDHSAGLVRVDEWAKFKAAATVGVMVRELRAEMDRLLAAKIADPDLELSSYGVVAAVEELLSSDGF